MIIIRTNKIMCWLLPSFSRTPQQQLELMKTLGQTLQKKEKSIRSFISSHFPSELQALLIKCSGSKMLKAVFVCLGVA